jgi:hypothetical protein
MLSKNLGIKCILDDDERESIGSLWGNPLTLDG